MEIDGFIVPKNRLSTLLSQTKKIYDKFGDEETGSEQIASFLGYEQRGTAFYTKFNDLKFYGLLEAIGRKVRVTDLGKQAIIANDVGKHSALEEIIRHNELWNILLKNFGENIEKENFPRYLAEIAGVKQSDVQDVAESVRRAYLEDVRYVKTTNKTIKQPEFRREGRTEEIDKTSGIHGQPLMSEEAIASIFYPEYSQAPIEIKDGLSYEIAQKLMEAIGVKLGLKKKPEQAHL